MRRSILLVFLVLSAAARLAGRAETITGNCRDGTVRPNAPLNEQVREVEWLESTGTQFILFTGYSIDGIDIWVRPENLYGEQYGACGVWNGYSASESIRYSRISGSGFIVQGFGGSILTGLSMAYRHVTVSGRSVNVDGNEYTLKNKWGNSYFSNNFALFGSYNDGNWSVRCTSCRIGPCKLYTGSTLKLDLAPVRIPGRGGAMLDRVSGTVFFNHGTGEFIVGPDKE